MNNLDKNCAICDNKVFIEVLHLNKAFYSDGTSLKHPLIKEECTRCGTIRTQLTENLNNFYKYDYIPSRNTDTLVISDNEELTRSSFVYNWIMELLSKYKKNNFESILEIGCGQGYLLNKFNIDKKYGIEPNISATTQIAPSIDLRNIGYEDINNNEKYNIVMSYCVIEHIEKPKDFLEKCKAVLSDDGLLCIGLPIQDNFNYDLFFFDHLYHYSNKNFITLLNTIGFEIINYELGKESYSNIGMYICKKKTLTQTPFTFLKNKNLININTILKNINNIILKKDKDLYAFGYGEVAKTIAPYTNLDSQIINYIDDFSTGTKVITSEEAKILFKNMNSVNIILLVNPMHSKVVINIFSNLPQINFINIFEFVEM